MPGFQSTRLVTEGALEPFFFLYTDDSIQGNPETCKQSSVMLNYEVKNTRFNSLREKNCSLRRAAVIHVEILPTLPSALGLSLGVRTRAGMIAVP